MDEVQVGNMTCHPNNVIQWIRPSNYCFRTNTYGDNTTSPYLYSPSAPVGPTSCEYCGKSNTNDCPSNLPDQINTKRDNSSTSNSGTRNNGTHNGTHNNNHEETTTCPRPKLFFLKKKPPFATSDGWNPKTDYRLNLLEPPSSVEGRRGAWGEVRNMGGNTSTKHSNRGDRGSGSGANVFGVGGSYGVGNQKAPSAVSGVAGSGCGSGFGYEESEVTCSSGGDCGAAGFSDQRGKDKALSPADWVSGLLEKL